MKNANTPNFLKTLKTPFLILMVGPPLVGKTTAIRKWTSAFDGEVTVISRDAIVMEHADTDVYSEAFDTVNQGAVNKELKQSMVTANDNKENVIIDMTNLSSKKRKETLGRFDDDYTKVAVVFEIMDRKEFSARNEKRKLEEKKFLKEMVISNMINSYKPIAYDEGFDKTFSYE